MRKRNFLKAVCAFILLLGVFSCSSDPDEPEIKVPDEEQNDPEPEPEEPSPEPEPELGDDIDPESGFEFYVGKMDINTAGGVKINSKENYVDCSISIDHINSKWNLDNVEAGIRGRGNSTWEWYPKKPYRIKFDKKQAVLGLGKAKSWVLLAEYRDPTDLMNAYVFELGQAMEMPFTNHNRYVRLTLNGEDMGLYHLTEQVQQGETRVDVADEGGILLSLDQDDGPNYSHEPDNFWSSVYHMPVCVKHPEEQTQTQLYEIRDKFAELEQIIKTGSYEEAEKILDMKIFADFLLIQELVYNVELDAPRSMYLHKDTEGKWTMGPLWDFDGGFDFDWGQMYTGHRYFSNTRELVMGTNPYNRTGASYNPPRFFTDLFRHDEFKKTYKEEWKKIKNLHYQVWETTKKYVTNSEWEHEQNLWPINLQYTGQISAMGNWLNNRIVYLNSFIPSL